MGARLPAQLNGDVTVDRLPRTNGDESALNLSLFLFAQFCFVNLSSLSILIETMFVQQCASVMTVSVK